MNSPAKNIWKVSTTYIGTVVGAGFASGQEVLKFFSSHGIPGMLGVMLSTVLFCLGGILLLYIGRTIRALSYKEVLYYVCGQRLGGVLNVLITFFLFGTLSVMLAGSGAVLFQQLHIPYLLGTLLTIGLAVITVLYGIKGIMNANSIVVPLLITGCLLIGFFNIKLDSIAVNDLLISGTATRSLFSPHWTLSALLYVAYNLTLSIGVIAPLGREVPGRHLLLWCGITGGLILGLLVSLINLSILSNLNTICLVEIPMLSLATSMGRSFQDFYALILWAEIFTTIIANAYSLTTHITENYNLSYKRTLLALMLFGLLFSQAGFSNLVGFLYPLFGYVSLVFLAGLFSKPFRMR